MEIRPILSSLRKHKIPAALIVLEIALACAVFCNAVFMIGQRINNTQVPNAIDQTGIVVVRIDGRDPKLASADIPRDIAALKHIRGVAAAAAVTSVPLSDKSWISNVSTLPPAKSDPKAQPLVAMYQLGTGGPQALGLHLLKGRFFNADEYADSEGDKLASHVVVITQTLAHHMWPDGTALGKRLWLGKSAYTVVGIVADVLGRAEQIGSADQSYYFSTFFPESPAADQTFYVVRTTSRDRERVLHAATGALQALSPNAVIRGEMYTRMRDDHFATARSMVWILVLVCVVMLAVTAFGIVGLTSFWVRQRRKQIGIRRAVGATRARIRTYFQTENFLLSLAGVVFGVIAAYGVNLYLMQHYQLHLMPWYYPPVSAIALWILGQLAVLGPALRASHVPPVVATRSV
jgi:putative ABC transport system permease protein